MATTSTAYRTPTLAPTPRVTTVQALISAPQRAESLRVEVVTISPDIAAAWLTRNALNRPLRRNLVSTFMAAIANGRWDDVNGETIIFADTGVLLDGQHRLTAVVESQRAIVSLVVFGVSATKRGTIDTGAKRQLSDVLAMAGTKNATNVAAMLVLLHAYEQGALLSLPHGARFTSYAEGEAYLASHPGVYEAVETAKRIGPIMRPSHAALLSYLFTRRDAQVSAIWASTLIDGQQRPGYEAFLALRERLIRHRLRHETWHQLDALAFNIKAWNRARMGKTLHVFKWEDREGIPEIR